MKIIIFSDTHLNRVFDQKKFDFLKKVIDSADQVIINGDFWEGFDMSFDEFVDSKWKRLFPYLLKKDAIYVYGNHDPKHMSNGRVKLFSKHQTRQYKLKLKEKTYIFEHGDRFLPLVDLFFKKYLGSSPPMWLNQWYERFEKSMIKTFGKNYLKHTYGKFNSIMKSKIRKIAKENEWYVFGHSHLNEYDRESRFINSGLVRHGLGQYILINNNEVQLIDEQY